MAYCVKIMSNTGNPGVVTTDETTKPVDDVAWPLKIGQMSHTMCLLMLLDELTDHARTHHMNSAINAIWSTKATDCVTVRSPQEDTRLLSFPH